MKTMEELVKSELSVYDQYRAQIEFQRKCPRSFEQSMILQSTIHELRVLAIECWLQILTADEQFVVQKHLIEGLEWPRVAHAFEERWGQKFIRSERALVGYQTSAIKKVVEFCMKNELQIRELFDGGMWSRVCEHE